MNKELEKIKKELAEIVDPSIIDKWFETPNASFDNNSPLEIHFQGKTHLLWEMLYRLQTGMPG